MFWHSFFIILSVGFLFSILPTQVESLIVRTTGCHHNGTWYADNSIVPSMEKCLTCQCAKKTLVCRLKVCPEMPLPPPRGCVVVQKKNTCCPYLSCARLNSFYNILPTTRRIIAYLDHYERESIDRAVNENALQRRSDDSDVDLYVCVKNGTVYKSGSAMSSSNLCTYCYCIGGTEKCVKPKCMLPVEGCKPIFVDSTCCPVRYDCSTKPSGKSSQEVRYRKTSNKHFLRASQRLQRNRGCTLNGNFYAEGQKMRSDLEKPCDICFCIRGSRRCAPKKCSPALKNCIPVVPKGQCCPSSYDCGNQLDSRRAHNSRQFNLFSLLFGPDGEIENDTATIDMGAQYPLDRHPITTTTTTTQRTLLDRLREGLEFIDGNNNQMISDNVDLVALAQSAPESKNVPNNTPLYGPTTEMSFLDLLLAPSDPVEAAVSEMTDVKLIEPEKESVLQATNGGGLSWVDLLLGSDEEETQNTMGTTISDKLNSDDGALMDENLTPTNIDRVDEDSSDEILQSGEIPTWIDETSYPIPVTSTTSTTSTTATSNSTISGTQSVTQKTNANKSAEKNVDAETSTTTTASNKEQTKILTTTIKPLMTTALNIPIVNLSKHTEEKMQQMDASSLGNNKPSTKDTAHHNDTVDKVNKTKTTIAPPQSTKRTTQKPTTAKPIMKLQVAETMVKPAPMFKPLPNVKTHVRINSKIANLSEIFLTTELNTFKPLPNNTGKVPILKQTPLTTVQPMTMTTAIPHTTRTTTTTTEKYKKMTAARITTTTTTQPRTRERVTTKPTHATTTKSAKTNVDATTVKAVVIKTNPTILDVEPIDTNAEPTLPPSLPNLKIIPFLPTDAVELDRSKPLYDYDVYDQVNLYPIPSITEKYPTYTDLDDASKAEYIYKFKIEGPPAEIPADVDKMDIAVAPSAFIKYEFTNAAEGGLQTKGFSPPTKTEGGFIPKNPLIIDDMDENNIQVTKHIIDITTAEPNTTKLIEITTPDPFKDVIHTESPPDLSSLIEDKTKIVNASIQLHNIDDNNASGENSDIEISKQPNESVQNKDNKNIVITTTMSTSMSTTSSTSSTTTTTTTGQTAVRPELKIPPTELLQDATQTTVKQTNEKITKTPTSTMTTATTKRTATTSRVKNAPKLTTNRKNQTTTTRVKTSNATTTATRKTKPKVHVTRRPLATTTTTATAAATITTTSTSTTVAPITMKSTKPPKSIAQVNLLDAIRTTTVLTPLTAIAFEQRTPSATTLATTTTTTSTTPTRNPFFNSPFDKLPFMNASFEVKRRPTKIYSTSSSASASASASASTSSSSPTIENDLLGLVHYKNSLNKFEGLEPTYYKTQPSSTSYSTSSLEQEQEISNENENSSQSNIIYTSSSSMPTSPAAIQHSPSNSLIDPAGILKLAGCNIYGRMYRVGRIILELSSACVECKCTEVGVKCGPLDC